MRTKSRTYTRKQMENESFTLDQVDDVIAVFRKVLFHTKFETKQQETEMIDCYCKFISEYSKIRNK